MEFPFEAQYGDEFSPPLEQNLLRPGNIPESSISLVFGLKITMRP